MHIDCDKYIQFVKHLYCRKSYGDPKTTSFDVRRLSMTNNKDPKKWLPPQTALKAMSKLFDLQINYLLTAGKASAFLPDFLGGGCLVKAPTGEVEYNFGSESYLTSSELSQLTVKPKTPTKKGKKRTAANTPQKGRRKIPQLSSTPVKGIPEGNS